MLDQAGAEGGVSLCCEIGLEDELLTGVAILGHCVLLLSVESRIGY
jgi:hypothetical protein